MKKFTKYLTQSEHEKIEKIEKKILNARTVKEVKLYREQIGLIMQRIIIRKRYSMLQKKK